MYRFADSKAVPDKEILVCHTYARTRIEYLCGENTLCITHIIMTAH